ncbi:hypothetical protein [Streptomyces badius]|uniref:Transposase IS701-like DDE domain-containing protein n=1 Tax=Streptomyces badius TaxID=1941 RepID=A0ABQ2TRG9_STRBA|nr:hypothetical protein [Streptomyces badius]GGS80355.1 hypothetical protein GCM10010253_63970 [Streptomyces badius]
MAAADYVPLRDLSGEVGPSQTVASDSPFERWTWTTLLERVQVRDDVVGRFVWIIAVDSASTELTSTQPVPQKKRKRGRAEDSGHSQARQAVGHCRGGLTAKVPSAADVCALPLSIMLVPGNTQRRHRVRQVLDGIRIPPVGAVSELTAQRRGPGRWACAY